MFVFAKPMFATRKGAEFIQNEQSNPLEATIIRFPVPNVFVIFLRIGCCNPYTVAVGKVVEP